MLYFAVVNKMDRDGEYHILPYTLAEGGDTVPVFEDDDWDDVEAGLRPGDFLVLINTNAVVWC